MTLGVEELEMVMRKIGWRLLEDSMSQRHQLQRLRHL
jgi:hypothetical protein